MTKLSLIEIPIHHASRTGNFPGNGYNNPCTVPVLIVLLDSMNNCNFSLSSSTSERTSLASSSNLSVDQKEYPSSTGALKGIVPQPNDEPKQCHERRTL